MSPDEDEYDLKDLLVGLGFTEDQIERTYNELNGFRTIPGTTIKKYLNRALSTVESDRRPEFLKGLIVGTAIREQFEATRIDDYISSEVARRLKDLIIESDKECS